MTSAAAPADGLAPRSARLGPPTIRAESILIDHRSRIPPFEQLRAQLALLISSGRLRPGDRLPTVRELACGIGLAAGTVARAYRELEYAGIVHGEGRRGTFVCAEPPNAYAIIERRRQLSEAAAAYVLIARQLGVDHATTLEGVTDALRHPG